MLLLLGNVPCVSCLLFIAFGRLSGFVIWMVGFGLGSLFLCLALEVVVGLWRPGIPLLWTLRRFCLALVSLMFMSLLLMWLSLLTLLIVVFWIWYLGVWVFPSDFVGFILVTTLMFGSGLSLLVVLVCLGQGMEAFHRVVRLA